MFRFIRIFFLAILCLLSSKVDELYIVEGVFKIGSFWQTLNPSMSL